MIGRLCLVLVACAGLAGPALALDAPLPSAGDPNIRTAPYAPSHRWLIVGVLNRATTITFGSTETIARVTMGSDDAWEGPDPGKLGTRPLRNNLPLWPRKKGHSNLQVVTALPDGSERLYQFALVAIDLPEDGSDPLVATYGLVFTYPDDARVAASQAARARRTQADNQAAAARLKTDVFYGQRHWRYVARGDRDIAPLEVSDNGRLTALRFPGRTSVPAIYRIAADGSEQLVSWTMKDDFVVVQATARRFVLRQGGAVLELRNLDFDRVGPDPRTGTTSPDVVRVVRTR